MMLPTKEQVELLEEYARLKDGVDDERIAEVSKRLKEISAEQKKGWPFA